MVNNKIVEGVKQVGEGVKESIEQGSKQLNKVINKLSFNMVVEEQHCNPFRGHPVDAGLDLKSAERVVIPKGGSAVINTGVRFEIPEGYYGKLETKSGLNINHSVVCLGGVIDCGYTGIVYVKLYNFGDDDYVLEPGDKCVQIIFHKCYIPTLTRVEALEETERGENGFGSTGK